MTATLFLLVGLPGSGKTTRARQLETEHRALRLTPDEWMEPLFGAGDVDGKRDVLERRLLWSVAARALSLGVNVVLDFGFWLRSERKEYRAWGEALGAQVELVFLDVPAEELWRRLEARNRELPPSTFPVTRAELDEWTGWFEVPTPDELNADELADRA